MRERAVTNTDLLMNGSDHLEPQTGLPAVLEQANALLAREGLRLTIGTLPQYLSLLREALGPLPRHTGEFRSGYFAHLLLGVLSTRMWLKQHNAAGKALLTRLAEPAAAWAWALGGASYPAGLLGIAWKHLLHNHPHDSICGCGIDQVHAEMLPRFAQSAQIGEEVTEHALAALAEQVDTQSTPRAVPVVICNPAGGPRTGVVRCEAVLRFGEAELVDGDGRVLPHQVLSSYDGVLLNERADKALVAATLGMAADGHALGYSILAAYLSVPAGSDTAELELTVSQKAAPNLAVVQRTLPLIHELLARDDISSFHVVAREARKTDLLLLARDLPAYGGRVLYLRPRKGSGEGGVRRAVETAPLTRSVHAGPDWLENAHLR